MLSTKLKLLKLFTYLKNSVFSSSVFNVKLFRKFTTSRKSFLTKRKNVNHQESGNPQPPLTRQMEEKRGVLSHMTLDWEHWNDSLGFLHSSLHLCASAPIAITSRQGNSVSMAHSILSLSSGYKGGQWKQLCDLDICPLETGLKPTKVISSVWETTTGI